MSRSRRANEPRHVGQVVLREDRLYRERVEHRVAPERDRELGAREPIEDAWRDERPDVAQVPLDVQGVKRAYVLQPERRAVFGYSLASSPNTREWRRSRAPSGHMASNRERRKDRLASHRSRTGRARRARRRSPLRGGGRATSDGTTRRERRQRWQGREQHTTAPPRGEVGPGRAGDTLQRSPVRMKIRSSRDTPPRSIRKRRRRRSRVTRPGRRCPRARERERADGRSKDRKTDLLDDRQAADPVEHPELIDLEQNGGGERR